MKNKIVEVNEEYQNGYSYTLTQPIGKNFDSEFTPDLSPQQMLQMGIFGGDYFTSVPKEFPAEWFEGVKFSSLGTADKTLNFYKVNASQPLKAWQAKGWIYFEDPKGWFLWYCRYYMGRRIPDEDARQIKRWKNMRRHITQVQKNCRLDLPKTSQFPGLIRSMSEGLFSEGGEPVGSSKKETSLMRASGDTGVAEVLGKSSKVSDASCRPRQRQALLHWAYDSRKI